MCSARSAWLFRRVVHELLKLFGRQKQFQFVVDSLHTLHVLGTRQAFLTKTRILEMHAIDGVNTRRINDLQLTYQPRGLLLSLILRRTLNTVCNRLLRHQLARKQGNG